jgi:hypothetical protein
VLAQFARTGRPRRGVARIEEQPAGRDQVVPASRSADRAGRRPHPWVRAIRCAHSLHYNDARLLVTCCWLRPVPTPTTLRIPCAAHPPVACPHDVDSDRRFRRTRIVFHSLQPDQSLHGFRASAVLTVGYRTASDGRRAFIHRKSGFTLDVLEIQSVPQAFIWVKTFPTIPA